MTISAIQSASSAQTGRLVRPTSPQPPVTEARITPMPQTDLRFGAKGMVGWGALILTGLALTLAKPMNVTQAQPTKDVQSKEMAPKVSDSTRTLAELSSIHNDSKLGSGFTIEKAKKATPLIKDHIKLLRDPNADVSYADLDKAATLAISNLYFTVDKVGEAYKAGQRDLTLAVLEWEGAIIQRAFTMPVKTADEGQTRTSLMDRCYGDLMWYSCYPESSDIWKPAAEEYAKQAFTGPQSHQPCYVKKMVDAMPSNNVAKQLFITLKTQAEEAITELDKEKALANPKRIEWLKAAHVSLPILMQVSSDTSKPGKIPADDQAKLKEWIFKQAHPTLVKVAHKALITPNLRVPERQLLVGLVAQGVGYEKQTEVIQRQLSVWGYDPTRALLSYPNNMADYTADDRKVRFNQKRYTVDMPKDPRDAEKGSDKILVQPFSSIFLDSNRVMYGGDQKVAPAYQGFDWNKHDPRIQRYTQTTMISLHLGTLRDLSNRDDVGPEFIGTGLIQFKQSVDEGFYRRSVGVSPVTWGEHAGLLLSVMGGKKNDVSDADFVKTKAAVYRPFMLGGTENKPLFGKDDFYRYTPGAFESYQTWVTECGVASAIVRKDVLKANDKLKGDALDDAVEKALGERARDPKFVTQVQTEARLMTPRGVAEELMSAELKKTGRYKDNELDQAVIKELDKRFNPRSKDFDKDFAGKVDKELASRLKFADLDKFVDENVKQARLGFIHTTLAYLSPQVPPRAVDAALESWGLRPEEIAAARKEPRPKYLQ